MFRNPRENTSAAIETPLKPSIGRPPTPPNIRVFREPLPIMASTKPLTPRPNSKTNVPSSARQSVKKSPIVKISGKSNASILNFFKKVDSPLKDESIFLSQRSTDKDIPTRPGQPSPETEEFEVDVEDLYEVADLDSKRFNELGGSVKRRKTSIGSSSSLKSSSQETSALEAKLHEESTVSKDLIPLNIPVSVLLDSTRKTRQKKTKPRGPFLDDSDSENELYPAIEQDTPEAEHVNSKNSEYGEQNKLNPSVDTVEPGLRSRKRVPVAKAQVEWEALQPKSRLNNTETLSNLPTQVPGYSPAIPSLKQESTSIDEWANFDDFPDELDEFADGEEFMERKWMEDQALVDAADEDQTFESIDGAGSGENNKDTVNEAMSSTCPICEASLVGVTSDDATRHVNGCLDGNPIPLQPIVRETIKPEPSDIKYIPAGASKRFQKAAIARPGQANPFEIGSKTTAPSSAFSKLMAGHAEDAAWATAAAAETSSRGKAAYQRTCPFYKIMPGFFIAVDAFRYGAVQGIKAYFLSHFHSDHYVGLTSTWCHGPIYCSKVTANLVIQQLKVDTKWVIALEFEQKSKVSGTEGVVVTMIPANHCPGSSLFLFEKTLAAGRGPKVQRVLHCGDFRACPAHIAHPMLMPDIVDSINGKLKQQKIDVCYLDTTYLNPRYAFPSQDAVITACADMCVSLTKERAEEEDAWEVVKRERAGTGMQKFVKNPTLKAEDSSEAMAIGNLKTRGRLLIVCGTYSIGKERICMGIARALDCKIWAPNRKLRICAALEDPELMSRMTDNPLEAQIHMQMLMELRPETLNEYLTTYKPHFSRIVGFRPSGWNYKPPNSRFTDSPTVSTVLHSPNWRSSFSMADLVPQRGSTKEASCFGVPYSEHSSFRELTMFICALRIEKVIPTVNVGSAAGRAKMKSWIERWQTERRKNGLIKIGSNEGEVRW